MLRLMGSRYASCFSRVRTRIAALSATHDSTWPPMMTPQHPSLLPTRRSVVIFGIALCVAVAGVTESVFAYRDYEMDTNASNGREFEVGASTMDRGPMAPVTFVPRQGLRASAYEAALASNERAPSADYDFSAVMTSIGGPIAPIPATRSVTSQPPHDTSKSPISALGVPESTAPVASAPPLSSGDTRPPPVAGIQCGSATCPEGQVCCNASCGTCAMPGETCSQLVCGMSTTSMSVSCGSNTCNVGESCCNASCGICARPGDPCDATKECENSIQYPNSVACGMSTCNVGLVCCNPSCGICARYGEPCSQDACD